MRKSSWSASEAARLMLGYLPDRPALGTVDDQEIKELEQDIIDSEGVAFWAVKSSVLKSRKRFSQKDLIKWAVSVELDLPYPLGNALAKEKKQKKSWKTERREKAVDFAKNVWSIEVANGKVPRSIGEMINKIRNDTSYGEGVRQDETIRGWIRGHHPHSEERKRIDRENKG